MPFPAPRSALSARGAAGPTGRVLSAGPALPTASADRGVGPATVVGALAGGLTGGDRAARPAVGGPLADGLTGGGRVAPPAVADALAGGLTGGGRRGAGSGAARAVRPSAAGSVGVLGSREEGR
jgi:hypothetical protein